MEQKHIYSREDKLKWFGEGPWLDEPDVVTFEYADMECLITRMAATEMNGHAFGGYLCGYVKIPENHPLNKKIYEDLIFDVHGGITFNEFDEIGNHLIGFECAHTNDIIPSMEILYKTDPIFIKNKKITDELKKRLNISDSKIWNKSYKTINYAIGECKKLAEQISLYEEPVISSVSSTS